jgi:site-specific DNA recombinase
MSLQGKRVAIYARFSSDRQRDTSIEDQIRRCTEHVRRLGGKVDSVLVFSDAAISGSTLARPGFEALMRLATSRPRRSTRSSPRT